MTSRPPRDNPPGPDLSGDLPAEVTEAEFEDEFEDAPEIPSGLDLGLDGAAATPASLQRGVAVIRSHLRDAPAGPGVYRMVGADGEVLYVGKARSIRKRIASYARFAGHNNRIARMIGLTASMVFVSTPTETEALLLETNFIKQMKPRFNVLMRDDKSFPYILLTGDHVAPQITKHRGARHRKGDYFGPFASVWAVNRTLNALQRAFLLRSCSDSYYENRTRPCLLYQIKRCSAPCTGEISHLDYAELVAEARDFLSGRSRAVRDLLAEDMRAAADALEFERAARLRDRIAALSAIQGAQGVNPRSVEEADVFAIAEEAGVFCIEVFFFRTYQNWGNRAYFPRADKSLEPAEVLGAFLAQFYADKPAARLVLLVARRSTTAPFSKRRSRCAPAIASRSPCRSAARSANWSIRRPRTAARRWPASSPTAPARRSFSPPLPRASASNESCAASRSTTIPISWGRMRSAR